MQVGRHDKLQLVSVAQIHDVAPLDHPRLERLVNQILQERQAHLTPEHRRIRRNLQHVSDQSRVIGFGVRAHHVLDLQRVDFSSQRLHVQLPKLFVTRVDQRRRPGRAANDVRVIRRPFFQPKLDVEPIAIPIERPYQRGALAERRRLRLQSLLPLEQLHVRRPDRLARHRRVRHRALDPSRAPRAPRARRRTARTLRASSESAPRRHRVRARRRARARRVDAHRRVARASLTARAASIAARDSPSTRRAVTARGTPSLAMTRADLPPETVAEAVERVWTCYGAPRTTAPNRAARD